jgi:beta-glucuronidase
VATFALLSGRASAELGVERIPLTGTWLATADRDRDGETRAYHTTALVPQGWQEVEVPCTFAAIAEDLETYVGTCWFRRAVAVPEGWRGKRVVLHFDGIGNQAKVWMNGDLIGGIVDPYLPCELPVGRSLRYGAENTIAVSVDNSHPHSGVPTNFYWRSDGGILRAVELRASDHLVLESVKIEAAPRPSGGGNVLVRATVGNERTAAARVAVRVSIRDPHDVEVCVLESAVSTVPAAGQRQLELTADLAEAAPWSPESPSLYTATVELLEGGVLLREHRVRFGFRKVEVRGVQVLLNGRPVYLFGFNRHEDTPRNGMALDPETLEHDLREIKRMGANFVRLCHYPHDTSTLDWCDELGLLVMCEIPFLGCSLERRGPEHRATETRLVAETTQRQMSRMIRRDWNHPSVILWSTGNENDEADPAIRAIHAELAQLSKRLDPTRLVTHVSVQGNWANPGFDSHEFDDVVGANAYGYMNYGDRAGEEFFTPTLDFYQQHRCDKPLFITEYGNWDLKDRAEPGTTPGARQVATLECDPAYLQRPFVCGSLIWLYADHTWPAGSSFFGITDGISPFGLSTRARTPGAGVRAAEKLFQQLGDLNRSRQATE